MLIRIATLVVAYPNQAHPILANHELSQLTRRGITKGSGNIVEMFLEGVEWVFGTESEEVLRAIDQFILAMPLAVKSESGLMCCHSLPNAALMHVFDTGILDRAMTDEDRDNVDGSATLMVWGRAHTEEQVQELAKLWGVTLFCLGHAHVSYGRDASLIADQAAVSASGISLKSIGNTAPCSWSLLSNKTPGINISMPSETCA